MIYLLILTIHNAPPDHWPPWFRDLPHCVAAGRAALMSAEVVRAECVRWPRGFGAEIW